jgi:LPXTG-motif cell wall-anchored protein
MKRSTIRHEPARVLTILGLALLAVLLVPLSAMGATADTTPADEATGELYPPPVDVDEVVEEDVVREQVEEAEEAEVLGVTRERPPAVAELPVTGTQLMTLLVVGLALVALGVFAVRATHHRMTARRAGR